MPKQKGPSQLSGKTGNMVFKTGRYGARAGAAPELTQKQKKEIASRPQNLRMGYLSRLASGILHATRYHAGPLVPGRFFNNLGSLLSKEKTDHRVLLLEQLHNMEVNHIYLFRDICPTPDVELAVSECLYTVEVEIRHPAYAKKGATCFYLEFLLFTWKKDEEDCGHEDVSTAWMSTNDRERKYCTLEFERSDDDTEYLLACRCVLGVNNKEDGWTSTAMYFISSGTLTAEGEKIVAERRAVEEAARNAVPVREVVKEKKRVEMRGKKEG